jgi:hypothetical protein
MNFYTDGINGSNAQLTLVGTNPSGSSKTANIIMQQPTGLIIQAGTGAPMQLWTNNSVVAQTLATDGSITMSYQLTLGVPPALSYTTVPTLASSQIGYNVSSGIVIGGTLTTTVTNLCSVTVNQGVYLIISSLTTNGWLSGTGNGTAMSIYVGSSQLSSSPTVYGLNSSFSYTTTPLHAVAVCTAGQNISLRAATNNSSSTIINCTIQAVRIS